MRTRHLLPAAALALGALTGLAACNSSDVLQVTDPDIINPSDVESAAGAAAVRVGAIARLTAATSGGTTDSEGLFLLSGLLADEWNNGDAFIARQEVDQRVITTSNTFLTDVDRNLQRARLSAAQAVKLLKQYNPAGPVGTNCRSSPIACSPESRVRCSCRLTIVRKLFGSVITR